MCLMCIRQAEQFLFSEQGRLLNLNKVTTINERFLTNVYKIFSIEDTNRNAFHTLTVTLKIINGKIHSNQTQQPLQENIVINKRNSKQ